LYRLLEWELIVRVLRGRVKANQVGLFHEQAGAAMSRAQTLESCIFAQVGRQTHSDGSEEIVVISSWTCLDALYEWVGGVDLLDSPVVAGGTGGLFEYLDIQHYEAVPLDAETASSADDPVAL
jgi:hypothetical protein